MSATPPCTVGPPSDEARARRRAEIAPGASVGVTEAMISELVETFYAAVRADEVLGPIFNGRVADWSEHLSKLKDFWSSVTLMTGRFKGAPMAAHAAMSEIEHAHFDRWLLIWRRSVERSCPAEAAALFVQKAEMIAQSLKMGLSTHRGELPPARAVPDAVRPYSRTPSFSEITVPAALRRSHNTASGVWALIHVEDGELLYRVTDPRRVKQELLLKPGVLGVIEPTILHEVEPRGGVRFYVEFLR